MSWEVEVENASVGDAHALLLESDAPEQIKQYVRAAIGDLVETHGNDVRVTFIAQGRARESGVGARIEVHGEAAAKSEDAPTVEEGPSVEQLIDRDYRANRSGHLAQALARIAGRKAK